MNAIDKRIRQEEKAAVKERRDKRRRELHAQADRQRQAAERDAAMKAADAREVEFRKTTPCMTALYKGCRIEIALGGRDLTDKLVGVEAVRRLAHAIALDFDSDVTTVRANGSQGFDPMWLDRLMESDGGLRPAAMRGLIQTCKVPAAKRVTKR